MKNIFVLLFCFILFGCSKNDTCDCKYSSILGIMIPENWTDEYAQELITLWDSEQKAAQDAQCRSRCD